MEAVVIRAKGDYSFEKVPIPEPGPNQVLVKVKVVGICAGDGKVMDGAERFWGKPGLKHETCGSLGTCYMKLPVIPGHEFSGRVTELGEGAKNHHKVDVGDLVVSEQIISCDKCRFCNQGQYQVCPDHTVFGFQCETNGAMAEYMIFPERAKVHKVPENVSAKHAAFVEPLACSIHGVELGNIQFNDVVVISGCGPIGLGMVAAASLKSPKCLIALDLYDWKLDVAKKCGAYITLNPSKCNLKEEIDRLSGGYGCDVYIEATGHGASVQQGLDVIARQGRFVVFSVFNGDVSADWSLIGDVKEVRILGGHLGPHCWPKAIEMVASNRLPLDDIITHTYPLKEFEKGIKMVMQSANSIKVMLIP